MDLSFSLRIKWSYFNILRIFLCAYIAIVVICGVDATQSANGATAQKSLLLQQLEPYIVKTTRESDGQELQLLLITIFQEKLLKNRACSICNYQASVLQSGASTVVLHYNGVYPGNVHKIEYMIKFLGDIKKAGDFSPDLRILFYDGTDVLFQGKASDLLKRIDEHYTRHQWSRKDVLFNAEANLFPSTMDENLAFGKGRWGKEVSLDYACSFTQNLTDLPSSSWPYRYLNSGVYTGFWPEVLDMLTYVQEHVVDAQPGKFHTDQSALFETFMTQKFAGNPFRQHIKLDHKVELFWAMAAVSTPVKSGCQAHYPLHYLHIDEDTSIISNSFTNTTPFVIHFNGKPLKKFYQENVKPKLSRQASTQFDPARSTLHTRSSNNLMGKDITFASICDA